MKSINIKGRRIWADLLGVILTALMFVIMSALFSGRSAIYDETSYDMTSNWLDENGKSVSMNELPAGKVTITHSLSGMNIIDKALCIKSSDTFLDASVDGRVLYHYAPTHPDIIGKSYGNYVHVIPLPPNADELTMTLTPVYDGDTADLRSVSIEEPAKFVSDIYRQGLPEFIACFIMIVFGVIMMLLDITGENVTSGQYMGFLPLGVFSAIIGIWSMNDTYILQSFTNRPELIKILCYLCMMIIAYPPVSFVASAAKRRDSKMLPALLVLIALNFITTVTLSGLGIVDPHYMLIFSHINIVIAMSMTIYLMIQATRNKTIEKQFLRTILIGMSAALFGVSIDLVRFWLAKNSAYGSSSFTRVGVLIFIIAEGIYLLKEKNRLLIEQGNAELMKKIAYTDALTGLSNRTAYYEKEEALKKSEKNCTFVLLDINWLKTVNDEYGHAEGDRHIAAAAKIIGDSLSELGTCYRIGGDEFAAILDTDDAAKIEQSLSRIEYAAGVYNESEAPPVPLQIAYGYAMYFPKNMSVKIAENMADKRMYEMKRIMKAIRK